MQGILLCFLNSLINVLGQVCLKKGVSLVENNMLLFKYINFYTILGFILYALNALLYIKILDKLEVSIAYPLTSLGYVFLVFISAVLLNEEITLNKLFGVLLIMLGVFFIAREGVVK